MSGPFTGGVLTNLHRCNGNGGQDGAVWILKFEAFSSAEKLSPVLRAIFESKLPATEATALDLPNAGEKTRYGRRNQNNTSMALLPMLMDSSEMLNMISLEKKRDVDWPAGKFPVIYNKIKTRFAPDDDVAEMDMEDDLRRIKCAKQRDPKKILTDIAAVAVQYSCNLSDSKKAACGVRAGRANYAAIIAVTGTSIRGQHNRAVTGEELVAEIHK